MASMMWAVSLAPASMPTSKNLALTLEDADPDLHHHQHQHQRGPPRGLPPGLQPLHQRPHRLQQVAGQVTSPSMEQSHASAAALATSRHREPAAAAQNVMWEALHLAWASLHVRFVQQAPFKMSLDRQHARHVLQASSVACQGQSSVPTVVLEPFQTALLPMLSACCVRPAPSALPPGQLPAATALKEPSAMLLRACSATHVLLAPLRHHKQPPLAACAQMASLPLLQAAHRVVPAQQAPIPIC